MNISYTTISSPIGIILVAATKEGICAVHITDEVVGAVEMLKKEFPKAETLSRNDNAMLRYAEAVAGYLSNTLHPDLPLHMQGTEFQKHIWRILMTIPPGETRTYAQIADMAGRPSAVRAVASACGKNKIALLIPCHRIVRKDGTPSGYRWGLKRKEYLLKSEQLQL